MREYACTALSIIRKRILKIEIEQTITKRFDFKFHLFCKIKSKFNTNAMNSGVVVIIGSWQAKTIQYVLLLITITNYRNVVVCWYSYLLKFTNTQ